MMIDQNVTIKAYSEKVCKKDSVYCGEPGIKNMGRCQLAHKIPRIRLAPKEPN